MSYLGHTLMEVLRVQNPVPNSSEFMLERDAKVGKYHFKAGDTIHINITGLHKHPEQWQKPNEFRPERFDSRDPLFVTPNGKSRKPLAFCAFLGGKRACFGKTFAEANIKVMAAYMAQVFNMEWVDKSTCKDTHSLPLSQTGQSEWTLLKVRLTTSN